MSSQLPGMFTNTAVRAAMFKAFVRVMPTKNDRNARNGNLLYKQPDLKLPIECFLQSDIVSKLH